MNITAFNCMMAIFSWAAFFVWFWTAGARAGTALLILLIIWALGNLTKGKVKIK